MSDSPNYLVRVLKGRDYSQPEPVKTEAESVKPVEVEMPDDGADSESDDSIPPDVDHKAAPVSAPVESSAEERTRQSAEADRIERERQAELEARRKAREERAAAREEKAAAKRARREKNDAIRVKRHRKIEAVLPRPFSFLSVSSAIQTRIDALALVAKSGREPDARKLASAYESAGFWIMDLRTVMGDHFEEEARVWSEADPIEAWISCRRADWLAWACSGVGGWGYPGLWAAAQDCVRQAIVVASPRIPKEVSVFLLDIVKDLDVFISSWRRETPNLDLIDDLRRSVKKLIENISGRIGLKPDLAIALKAAEAVRALVTLDPLERPPVDAVARAAAVLAATLPEHTTMPVSWLPDDPERGGKWASEGRPRAEIKSKLAFMAPLVRKRIPVPVAL